MSKKEEFEKLKMEYRNIEIPDNGRAQILDAIKQAKQDKKRARRIVMIRRWAVVAAVITIMVLPNTSKAIASTMQNIPIIGKLFSVVTVRDYTYDDGEHSASVKLPQISVREQGEDSEAVKEINNDIKTNTDRLVQQFQKDIKKAGYKGLDISYDKVTDTNTWFTIRFNILETQASGYERHRYYNIDKKTGEYVKLKDLFKPDTDYVDIISREIISQMKASDVSYFLKDNEVFDGFDKISPTQNFYFNSDGNLIIAFDEYEVGPGYIGSPEFTIQKNIIEDIME